MFLIFYYNWSTFDSTAHSDREWLMWTNHSLEKNSGVRLFSGVIKQQLPKWKQQKQTQQKLGLQKTLPQLRMSQEMNVALNVLRLEKSLGFF